jgi:hypothetical protein
MNSSEPWYVSERAENLAIVLLTSFSVLVKRESDRSRGIDLRVVIDPKKTGLREFGVEVKGTTRIDSYLSEDFHVRAKVLRPTSKALKGYIFPVALMLFNVITDEGFFGWLLAPKVTTRGPLLEEPDAISLAMATNDCLESAFSDVRRWYDARPLRTNGKG